MSQQVAASPSSSLKIGPKIALMGESGTGKTHAIGTLVDWCASHGKDVFVLFTENGQETLSGYWKDRNLPIPSNLYWSTVVTRSLGLKDLMDAADKVGKLSYEAVTKLSDPNRSANNSFLKILGACSNFKDDRTGKEFGPVDSFTLDQVFVMDSLSETANSCMKMVIGNKPTAALPDYGVAQNNLMNFLRLLTQGCVCPFAMTAHVSREKDEISGATKITIQAIGSAISSQIPPLFSDVILTTRESDKFYWDTAAFGAATKTRSLGYRSKINPDFGQIMDVWVKRSAA